MNKLINGSAVPMDKNKDWQLELLMEKLRSKANQLRSFQEISKTVRMTMLDKRYSLDTVEKSQHQKCLDTLQHCIKVTSLQSMVERLESLTRQLGLKFMVGPSGIEVFISSDMFYLEIILDQNGTVRDVKVHHEGKTEQQSCAELVSCLSRQDFTDFTAQLEGFASIYQLNAEKKIKCKAFTALQSLESDLSTLAQLQPFLKEPFNLIHKSPVGILEKRRGGHPMRLTYFLSPYDLLDTEKGELEPISVDKVISKNLGSSVTVCMEGSAAHKLQTSTLITINRNMNGKGTPSFAQLNNQNSAIIPACFLLRLNKPMPICVSLINQIQQLTEMEWMDVSGSQPLLNLIANHVSDGKVSAENNKGLFVTLPDQHHCYFMTENKNLNGIIINSVPLTHPGHVSQILAMLRQQALFNSVISSCVRPNSKQDFENMVVFEISVLSWTQISISLEHPMEETMATAEIDLGDIANLQCKVSSPGTPPPANTPDSTTELATKVLNRSMSIPVTMRAIIRQWDKQTRKHHFNGLENFSLPLGAGDPGGHKNQTNPNDFGAKSKQDSTGTMNLMSHPHQGVFLNDLGANFPGFPPAEPLSNIELTNILSGSGQGEKKRPKWKGGKRRPGEEVPDHLLESSSSDSTSRSTQLSNDGGETGGATTPNSGLGFHSDLELGLDPSEFMTGEKGELEFDNLDDLDVEEMFAGTTSKEHKSKKQRSPNTLEVVGLEGKIVSPSVSITPITSQQPSFISTGDRKSGIEIIPLPNTPASLPSSITITPIHPQHKSSMDDRNRDRKSSKSRSEDRSRLEKKRKRKRDDSPMGPPDKIPTKQDPLSKPVSVSIKPAESPPLITPTSPNLTKKYASSPTQNKTFSVSGKLSPNLMKSGIKSPKHSPAHITSPKNIPSISSPKSHGTSPKHPSSTSGKPSMSALKNAANSPSSKSSGESKSKSKDCIRDKEKKFSVNNLKVKSSLKIKQLDLSTGTELISPQSENLPSPNLSPDISKSVNAQRNRKGLLSAVIDKLKSAQNCDPCLDIKSNRERSAQILNKLEAKSIGKTGEMKNSEYMVKPSSDGIKITINKTRKESKSGVLKLQSTGSPKTHTGLKPGVNSGPASKKPQQFMQKSTSSPTLIGPNFSFASKLSSNKLAGTKPSGLAKIGKLSGSPKSSISDLSRKDRPRINKSSSEKSVFSRERKSSPTATREETETEKAFKIALTTNPFSGAPIMAEGLIKTLDKNFQIPKLSARNAEDKKAPVKNSETINNVITTTTAAAVSTSKIFDMIAKNDVVLPKYPLAIPTSKMFDTNINMEAKIRNSMNIPLALTTTSSPKPEEEKKEPTTPLSTKFPSDLSTKSVDLTSMFAEKKDVFLDLVPKGDCKPAPVGIGSSSSVSVHIVKSPAPSPLVNPSPHSASPCITDDELMDEALIGLGK